MNKGICTTADLADENGSFIPWEMVSLEFSLELVEFLHWHEILRCVPTQWKQKMHSDTFSLDKDHLYTESIKISFSNNAVPVLDTSTKSIYSSLVQSKFKPPTSKQYFIRKFDTPGDSWKNIYSLPSKVAMESKTQIFQYKILNNILYLSHWMFHMKIVSSHLCSFCGESLETGGHSFLRCRYASTLWLEVKQWLQPSMILPNLTEKLIFLGFLDNQSNSVIINHLILLFKKFLYESRENKFKVNVTSFQFYVSYIYEIENKIAKKLGKIETHLCKWQTIADLLPCR